jgi:REP element-mobilizing transposase RayT
MARPLRLEFAGALYHLTSRGDHREDIYLDDQDRRTFLDLLGKEILQQRWLCYAYCLMDNHYHLLIETPEANLVRGMRRLNGVYTQSFNRRHARVGHVFQGRYKAIIVDKENYLLEPLYRAEPGTSQDRCDGGKVAVVKLSSQCGGERVSQVVGGRESDEFILRPAVELSEVCL